MMSVFIEIKVGPVEQVLKPFSFAEKWVKPVPQGSMSVWGGVKVGEGTSLSSLHKASKPEAQWLQEDYQEQEVIVSRKMGHVW